MFNNLIYKKMFSTESLKKAGMTLAIVMIALVVHQKFVAPMLVKKAPVTPK